jgi:AraC-like DNA-binding protein
MKRHRARPTEAGTPLIDDDRNRANQEELAGLIMRHVAGPDSVEVAPGLFLNHASAPTGPRYAVSEPSFCVIAQGSKEVFLGGNRYRYDPSHYLLVSVGLPLVGHVIEASPDKPYLAMRLVLDPTIVTSVLIEADLDEPRGDGGVRALAVSRLDESLLETVLRLARMLDTPDDYSVLAPLATREIVYRLLRGEQADRLRQIAVVGGRMHRIARAIQLLRENYDQPLSIADMANQLGMSVSGFHHHFKSATAMSPLQFQKRVRLQEARRLLLSGEADAATAGFRVGYQDQSHFSREYKRMFGEPPMRDVRRLRAPAGRSEASAAGIRALI